MDFKEYQERAKDTAIYKDKIIYPALELSSEAGEVCGKVKNWLRGDYKSDVVFKLDIIKEIGDCLWDLAMIANDLDICLNGAAEYNLAKLQLRKEKGLIQGSGDNREV